MANSVRRSTGHGCDDHNVFCHHRVVADHNHGDYNNGGTNYDGTNYDYAFRSATHRGGLP